MYGIGITFNIEWHFFETNPTGVRIGWETKDHVKKFTVLQKNEGDKKVNVEGFEMNWFSR